MSQDPLYNLSQLREVAAGSEDFVNKMVDMFLEMTPALVQRVADGTAQKDWDEVQSASHKMKPSIDMMGIASLHDVIREIEQNAKHGKNVEDIPGLLQKLQDTLAQVYEQLRAR